MHSTKRINNRAIIVGLLVIMLMAMTCYQFINVNMKYFDFVMRLRSPKLLAMTVAAICIGSASIMFQSVINNRIVTPCLLGMNSLYILIHTVVVFVFGSTSTIVNNQNLAFILDVLLMGIIATTIYGYLFRKTNYNVLYVLLIGTVLATFFGSISSTLMRIMEPNSFATLQDSILASFNNINTDVLVMAVVLIIGVFATFWKDIQLLDVITLGRSQAINLGVDYDKTIQRILMSVTLLIAIATAVVGPISFLGLIIANISRQLFSTYKHTYLIAGSAMVGVIILVGCQLIVEHVLTYNATVSVFINIFGGIYFLYLILKTQGA
ncbi:MAG: CRISPR-associated protein Cas5 [Epulopiscium sp. Nele67-Bin005]|nr:MAG: CRISPR-associated protein Cas5 [Epulopiscium sp. Nele67-Bin005]